MWVVVDTGGDGDVVLEVEVIVIISSSGMAGTEVSTHQKNLAKKEIL